MEDLIVLVHVCPSLLAEYMMIGKEQKVSLVQGMVQLVTDIAFEVPVYRGQKVHGGIRIDGM